MKRKRRESCWQSSSQQHEVVRYGSETGDALWVTSKDSFRFSVFYLAVALSKNALETGRMFTSRCSR